MIMSAERLEVHSTISAIQTAEEHRSSRSASIVWLAEQAGGSRRKLPRPLRDKPSIAVLPFINMSGDADQQYFSDGITEDIITELSRFRQLHVLARNSSFRFRGNDVDMMKAGRELGVQYLVEGSVRRLGDAHPHYRAAHRCRDRQSYLGGTL